MRLAHRSGISLKSAWAKVKHHDPVRRHRYRVHHVVRRSDPMVKHRRYSHRRRHDPLRMRGGGMMSKLLNGVVFAGAAVLGKNGAGYLNAAVPQANIGITSSKAVNLVSFAAGAVVSAFGPKSGMVGSAVQGLAGGVAGGSDPVSSSLGGGAVRSAGAMGGVGFYGSIGV